MDQFTYTTGAACTGKSLARPPLTAHQYIDWLATTDYSPIHSLAGQCRTAYMKMY